MLGLVPAQSQAIIASVDFGAWPAGSGGPLPQDSEAIHNRALSIWPGIDINTRTDTRHVLNDCCLYLARGSRSRHIFWFRDGPGCDMLALQGDLDPTFGIPVAEGLVVDVIRRAPGWGIYRVLPRGAELQAHGLVDQLDVNDLSSLESDQTDHMLASPDPVPEIASGSDVEVMSISDEAAAFSSSFLQRKARLFRGSTLQEPLDVEPSHADGGLQEDHHIIQVWRSGCQPFAFSVKHSATYANVEAELQATAPGLSAHNLVPVFPQGCHYFWCVAPGSQWNGLDCVALLVAPAPYGTQAVHVASSDTDQSLLDRLGITRMRLQLGDRSWNAAAQGYFHGMQLRAMPCHAAMECEHLHGTARDGQLTDWGPPQTEHTLLTGLDGSMLQFVFSEFALTALSQDISALGRLHSASAAALAACPFWCGAPFTQVRIYTDGSYCSRSSRAAWAVCVVVCCDHQWQFAGFASDEVFPGERRGSLGQDHVSAHVAELTAMAVAAALVGNLPRVSVDICFDAMAAAGVAEGIHKSQVLEFFSTRVTALMYAAQCRRGPVGWRHVRAHQGDPLNELADNAAKAVLSGRFRAPLASDHLSSIFQGPEILHLWWSTGRPELPCLDAHGAAAIGLTPPADPDALPQPHTTPSRACIRWQLRMVTYNCLSLCSLAQRDCLQQQFQQRSIPIIGLQETRRVCEPLSCQGSYVAFASQPLQGQLGCQLWISSCIPLGVTAHGSPILFTSQLASIFHASPRLLIVLFDGGGLSIAFCVAHAPTAVTAEEEQRTWWADFEARLRSLPRKYQPVILADTKARLSAGSSGALALSACLNMPARLMHDMMLAQHLHVSGNVADDGEVIVSWTGPRRQTACLDYLLLPCSMASGLRVWAD